MSYESEEARRRERWTCQECRKMYPVPILARDCEQKHIVEEASENRRSAEARISKRSDGSGT